MAPLFFLQGPGSIILSQSININLIIGCFFFHYRYPQFKIEADANKRTLKFNIMDKLKAALLRGDELETEVFYYLSIPLDSTHNHSGSPSLHPLITNKIRSLVFLGFTDLNEIKKSLRKYVNVELKKNFKIDTSDIKLFYPGMREIRRAVRSALEADKSVNISEFTQPENLEGVVVELPDNESLSKLLTSSGIQIYTIPNADEMAESLPDEIEANGSEAELMQVSRECEANDAAAAAETVNIAAMEEIRTMESHIIEVGEGYDAMNVMSIIMGSDDSDSFANIIQDKLIKIQQLSPALCDPHKRNSLMKALDIEIQSLMSANNNVVKVVEASVENEVADDALV